MRLTKQFSFILIMTTLNVNAAPPTIHVWEVQELTFIAKNSYKNAYTDVIVWIDLSGPGFSKRVYGFWDGGNTFRVRLIANQPGVWSWKSGSEPNDPGLRDNQGSFTAIE